VTGSGSDVPRVLIIAQPGSAWPSEAARHVRAAGAEPTIQDLATALETAAQEVFLCALCAAGAEAASVVAQLREAAPMLRVILAGPAGDVAAAVVALRAQPFDYLELPVARPALQEILTRAAWEPDARQVRWLESLQVLTPGLIHELRNPLSGVLAGSQLLGRLLQAAGGPSLEYAQIVREEAQHLERHLTRLAEFGRLGAQGWGVEAEVDLTDVLARALDRHRPGAQARAVELRVAAVPGAGVVRGDSTRLGQAVGELVANALEAVPDGGSVECRVESGAAGPGFGRAAVEVVVSDSGPGLSEDARRRAFEPFFSTKPRALGVGLPLAQVIAVRHGGTVRLDNHPAGGATAALRLPALPAA
jgi:signal transduction histidine kinase